MKISKELSTGMQVANLLATLLVIAIHYTSKFGAGIPSSITANFFFQELLTNNLARVAVPFFALSSGFFLFLSFERMDSYRIILLKRWKTLILPYGLASGLIFLLVKIRALLGGDAFHIELSELVNIMVTPLAGQFWFLRDLIILVLLSPIMYLMVKRGGILAPLFLSVLWFFEIQVFPVVGKWYLLNIETIFFFSIGCFLSFYPRYLETMARLKTNQILALLAIWVLISVLRVYVDPVFSAWYRYDYTPLSLFLYKISILIGVVSLVSLSSQKIFDSKRLLYISGYTFFAYMFHTEPILDVIVYFGNQFVNAEYVFYISFPLATIVVFGAAYVLEKYLTWLYMLLTGNRSAQKIVSRA